MSKMPGLNAATIACLIAKGLQAVDILDVARAMEAVERSPAAARQKRYRDRRRDVTRDVTVSPNDIDILTPSVTPVISSEITPPAENDDNPEVKPEHVLEAYNAMAVRAGLPQARMTPERRKKLGGFIRRHPPDDITEAISAMERSPLCRGDNDRGWKADFDFLLQPKSFTRLIEGTYGRQ